MRKLIALFVAASIAMLALTACGGDDSPADQVQDAAEGAANAAQGVDQ